MKLRECLKSFGWCGVRVEEIHATFSGEIKAMLEIHTRRMVEDEYMMTIRLKMTIGAQSRAVMQCQHT